MVERWISGYGMDLVGDRLNSAGVNCTRRHLLVACGLCCYDPDLTATYAVSLSDWAKPYTLPAPYSSQPLGLGLGQCTMEYTIVVHLYCKQVDQCA